MTEPIIEEKAEFQVLAMSREFHLESCMAEIPKFWTWYYESGYGKAVPGVFGVCHSFQPDREAFRYAIGAPYDGKSPVPDDFEVLTIPAQTWAVFRCVGPAVTSIQKMWKHIYGQWICNSGYEKLTNFDIEQYTPGDLSSLSYEAFVWIPVKKKSPAPPFTVRLNSLEADDFIRLFQSVGWNPPGRDQVERALKHSLALFSVYENGKLIGMGRLLGDCGMSFFLKDIAILPECQRRGAGTFLLQAVLDYIGGSLPKGWYAGLELLSTPGGEEFYKKLGFQELPNKYLSAGLVRMVEGTSRFGKQ